ncbi:hypothetical protein ELOC111193_15830 [Elizabethkingia occulta]
MEAGFSSASAFMDNNTINRRWGSMGKYTESINNNQK